MPSSPSARRSAPATAPSPPPPVLLPTATRTAYRVVAELQTIAGAYLPVHGHRLYANIGHGTACPGATQDSWIPVLQRLDNSRDGAMMSP